MYNEKLLKALDLAIYKISEMLMSGLFDPEHQENFERNLERIKNMRSEALNTNQKHSVEEKGDE